jgi:ankyrin repeat protein
MKFRFWGPMRFAEALRGDLDINLLDTRGIGPLHFCISRGDSEHFDRLLAAGADPNLPTSHTLATPLHCAAASSIAHFSQALLEAGADPNRTDRDKRSPIFDAIEANNISAVRLLLQHGADTAVVARGKNTPYGCALLGGHIEIACLLQDLPMGTKRTPDEWLYVAARDKLWRIIPHLIARGADIHAKDTQGRTALELAAQNADLYDPCDSGNEEYQNAIAKTLEALRAANA